MSAFIKFVTSDASILVVKMNERNAQVGLSFTGSRLSAIDAEKVRNEEGWIFLIAFSKSIIFWNGLLFKGGSSKLWMDLSWLLLPNWREEKCSGKVTNCRVAEDMWKVIPEPRQCLSPSSGSVMLLWLTWSFGLQTRGCLGLKRNCV